MVAGFVPSKTAKTTTQRGLGWDHQKRRASLLRKHIDGTLCRCQPDCGPACLCVGTEGLPMWRDPARNADGMPLEADHTLPRSLGGTRADRLLLATCNRSRGAGNNAGPVVLSQLTTSRSQGW